MAPRIKSGQVHSAVLVSVHYDYDDDRQLVAMFGIEGTPTFEFSALLRLGNGQDIPTTFKVGPHNIQELGAATQLAALMIVAIDGRL